MPDFANYEVEAPPRVSYATHALDAEVQFKRAVSERVVKSRWNGYVAPRGTSAADFAARLGVKAVPTQLSLYRGAEAALLAMCQASRPARLLVPEHSYPGFGRVARATGAQLIPYGSGLEVAGIESSDLVVVTEPGSPIDLVSPEMVLEEAHRAGALMVVDGTFAFLTPASTGRLTDLVERFGASLIVSASKSLGLAGVRLALLLRAHGQRASQPAMEWDVFQCAVIDELLSENHLIERAISVAKRQREFHMQLSDKVSRTGITVVESRNRFAVTVRDDFPSSDRYGTGGWKAYGEVGLVRLDATPSMLAQIQNASVTDREDNAGFRS